MPPDHICAHMVLLKYQNSLSLNAHAGVHTATAQEQLELRTATL